MMLKKPCKVARVSIGTLKLCWVFEKKQLQKLKKLPNQIFKNSKLLYRLQLYNVQLQNSFQISPIFFFGVETFDMFP